MKKSLTIGIPVYNEGPNIKKLINSLFSQTISGFRIDSVIISSDGSNDDTVKQVKSIKNSKIIIIDNKNRHGIARGLNQIINKTNSDVLVTLDADITIRSPRFIQSLISPILSDQTDLTSSAIEAIFPDTMIAKMLHTSMEFKKILFSSLRKGMNIYTCHGLARGYSRNFYSKLKFPFSIGNDMFSYLECVSKGFKFQYIPETVAWYKLPSNFADHQLQSERFFASKEEMAKLFDQNFVEAEFRIPLSIYLQVASKVFPVVLLNPTKIFMYIITQIYLRLKPKSISAKKQAWDIAVSSKYYK